MSDKLVNPIHVDLQNYIAAMPEYQRDREGGRLLIRAKEEIERLKRFHIGDMRVTNESATFSHAARE